MGGVKLKDTEKFTKTEAHIFLKAMQKELEICKEVDKMCLSDNFTSLEEVCYSIEKKVKKSLFGEYGE